MRKLQVFNQVSVDGCFADEHGDMSWAHKSDPEWDEFVSGNASGGGTLLFGRVTYDMMASFWPTPLAAQTAPVVAERMNAMEKVVASRTMRSATWNNTRILSGDLATEVRKLKEESGPGITILGSGTIVSQLTEARLVDEFLLVVNPLVLGRGRRLFDGVRERAPLALKGARTFRNGNVVLTYAPA